MAQVGQLFPGPNVTGFGKQASDERHMLAFALLETVRLVLEEGRDSDDSDFLPVAYDSNAGSDHLSCDFFQSTAPRGRRQSKAAALLGGPCAHCGATESPQWRRPLTKKVVLCNACGIYFSRHHSLPKRKKSTSSKRTQHYDTEDMSSGELDTNELEDEQLAQPELVPSPPINPSKRAHLNNQLKRSDSTSSADCMHPLPALLSVAAAAAAAGQAPSEAAPAAAAGGTYVVATRATRKRRATLPISLPPDLSAQGLARQTGTPPPPSLPLPPITTSIPVHAAAIAAESPASSPSALEASVRMAFTGAITTQDTALPIMKSPDLADAGMSAQQLQSLSQPIAVLQGPTANIGQSTNLGPNTILIPVTTCRGPRKVPSRKPSNVSSFGVIPQL